MMIENAAAYPFFLSEGIYLIKNDRNNLGISVPDTVSDLEGLADVATEILTVTDGPTPTFNYAGNNEKQFLVVCHYPDAELMDDKHFEALRNTLKRIEIILDDVAVINLAKHPTATAEQLLAYFKPKTLLILGDTTCIKGWNSFALNQPANVDGVKTLYTYCFTEMMGDRDKTKAFWEQMKLL